STTQPLETRSEPAVVQLRNVKSPESSSRAVVDEPRVVGNEQEMHRIQLQRRKAPDDARNTTASPSCGKQEEQTGHRQQRLRNNDDVHIPASRGRKIRIDEIH